MGVRAPEFTVAGNGVWWVLPLLAWNLALIWFLPAGAGGTSPVPGWLSTGENLLRVAVVAAPLLLTVDLGGASGRAALGLYVVGTLIYFATWWPWLADRAEDSLLTLLGPYLTPVLPFGALAWLCRSWWYLALVLVFAAAHVAGGLARAD